VSRFVAFACVFVFFFSLSAQADDAALTRARQHYEAGQRLYAARNYDDALRAFRVGYQIAARPAFLVNIGQCLRALHQPREARATFERFLNDAPTKDPLRKGVEELLPLLDQEIARLPPVEKSSSPPVQLQPTPAPPTTPPPPTLTLTTTPPPPPHKKGIRKLWWIIPVSATVVAAVTAGVVLGVSASRYTCPKGDICVDAGGAK
jgi:tetratricopeptide (TPR) repeat protein